MMFVYPLFLWALAVVSIPIIIHLFNFRKYKKVYFSNVKFLRELKQESKSKSRLKEILILAARCLALISIVFAFAQPVLKNKNNINYPGANAISIYIDNSFSMLNINKQGTLFESAKKKAIDLINAYSSNDKFQIITNDFEGKHQRFYIKEDAINLIDELKITPSPRSIKEVINRQNDFLNASNLLNKRRYLFSDFQKSTGDISLSTQDTGIKTILMPFLANKVNNLYIDSCWFDSPLQQVGFIQKLNAIIVNHSNTIVEAGSAKFFINNQQIALSSFSVSANSKTTIKFTFECKTAGFNRANIKIEDYPIIFDDELFFTFNSNPNISITLINGKDLKKEEYLGSLFIRDSLFKTLILNEQTIDFGSFRLSDVIILNQLTDISSGLLSELIKFSEKGGAIVFIPNSDIKNSNFNNALSAFNLPTLGQKDTSKLKTEKSESLFFEGVFEKNDPQMNLPSVFQHYSLIKKSQQDFESILKLQNNDDFLGYTNFNRSIVYLFTSPLIEKATNFVKHAIVVPTFYQLCFKSVIPGSLYYTAGSNEMIPIKSELKLNEIPIHIKQQKSEFDVIPEMRYVNYLSCLYPRQQIKQAGFYDAMIDQTLVAPLSFNFSRKESKLNCFSEDELSDLILKKGLKTFSIIDNSESNNTIQTIESSEGKKLWKFFIILALLFISIEVILLRVLK